MTHPHEPASTCPKRNQTSYSKEDASGRRALCGAGAEELLCGAKRTFLRNVSI